MKSIFLKICLFISSFIPLYFLIIVKELTEIANGNLTFNITNTVMLLFNFILILIGTLGLIYYYKSTTQTTIEIIEAKNITHQNFLSYFPIFVLFALAFELEFISMAIVYLLILVMIGIVYIKNDMFFINPFLNILGFKSYEITIKNGEGNKKVVRFSLNQIQNGEYFSNDMFLKSQNQNKFRKVAKKR